MGKTVETVYSLQHPDNGLFWNGVVHCPKFVVVPYRWTKLNQAMRRYADYLVARSTCHIKTPYGRLDGEAFVDAPTQMKLITERVVSTVVETCSLPGISGNTKRLSDFRNLVGMGYSYQYEDFRRLLRTKNGIGYQFLISPGHEFISDFFKNHRKSGGETLAQLVRRNLGANRARVIEGTIFVKNQKDLLVLKMKGEIPIEDVFDLHEMIKL